MKLSFFLDNNDDDTISMQQLLERRGGMVLARADGTKEHQRISQSVDLSKQASMIVIDSCRQ